MDDVASSMCEALGPGVPVRKIGATIHGRCLHSSTSQLNLSRFCSQGPQQASTSRLNQRRFCLRNLST